MANPSDVRKVPCPTCRKPAIFKAENAFRPFCSERCKLIDLGEWFNEDRRIPGSDEDNFPSIDDSDNY